MSDVLTLSASDLSALLCSKVCHDIISPVGAIVNGLELLDEGGADEDAMALIRSSANNASARLQFARIAFGAAGSAGSTIDTGEAREKAERYIANEKPKLFWEGERAHVAKQKVKLLMNLILVANAAVPRGGEIRVATQDLESEPTFTVTATGPRIRVPARFLEMHGGSTGEEAVDAHAIQYYYTLLMAKEAKMQIGITTSGESVTLTAR